MSTQRKKLTRAEVADAFSVAGPSGQIRPILSPAELAELLGLSRKSIYEWIAKGRLDGAFRKRGKHVLIWRDRAIEIIFNGKDWT